MTGVEIAAPAPEPTTVRIASVGYAGGGKSGGEIRLDGLQVEQTSGKYRLASFSVGGITLASTVAGLNALGEPGSTEVGQAAMRQLLPQVGTIRSGRFEAEMPASDGKPATIAVDSAEVTASNFVSGIPSNLRVAVNGVAIPLRTGIMQDATGQLASLGIKTLGFTLRTDAAWNAATRELGLREFSVALQDLGTVTARGVLGNVSNDLFNPHPAVAVAVAVASAAALGATMRSLDLDIEDRGMTDRGMKAFAAANGASVDFVNTMHGGSPVARSIGQAVGRFLAKPGHLRVIAAAKAPDGLAISDIAATQDPSALLDAVDVKAVTQ